MAAHAEIPILAFIIHNTSYIIYHHASHACHAPLRRTHMDPFHALRAFGEITGFPEDRRRPEATLRTKHSAYSYAPCIYSSSRKNQQHDANTAPPVSDGRRIGSYGGYTHRSFQ